MTAVQLVKLALKRDASVPMGQPAPVHLDCPCGTSVPVVGPGAVEDPNDIVTCAGCGARYHRDGWLDGV